IDKARRQRLLFARTAFTLEEAAGDLAGCEGLFLVVDGQREEIETRLRLPGGDHGGEHDRFAVGGEHGAIGLPRDLAGLKDERATAPLDFHFVMIEHVLSFNAGTARASSCGTKIGSLASLQDEPRARQRDASCPWSIASSETGFHFSQARTFGSVRCFSAAKIAKSALQS